MNDQIQSRTTGIGDNSDTERGHKLFNHVLALERLQEAKDEAGQDYNERKKILKSDGFDTNVTDAILKRRKNGKGQTMAFDELLAEYETQILQAADNAEPKPTNITGAKFREIAEKAVDQLNENSENDFTMSVSFPGGLLGPDEEAPPEDMF